MRKLITILIIVKSLSVSSQPGIVKDIYLGTIGSGVNKLTQLNSTKFAFTANDVNGKGLFVSNGMDAGTIKIVPITGNTWMARLGDKIIFDNDPNGAKNIEPYVSDGTASGTKLLIDIVPGSNGSFTKYIGNIGTTAIIYCAYGFYKTNGLPTGTSKLFQVSSCDKWLVFKNKVYFWGKNGLVDEGLWSFDENSNQPTLIYRSPNLVNDFRATVALGSNYFYFLGQDSVHGLEPWVSDGTTGGTHMLKDIYPGKLSSCDNSSSSNYTSLTIINDKVYFNATEPTYGKELWGSDGTESGTVLIKDIKTGTQSGNPKSLISAGNKFYFSSGFTASTTEYLGVSDGTEAGTYQVLDSTSNPFEFINQIYKFNSRVFFNSRKGLSGVEPFVSDGTTNGTFMIGNIDTTNFGNGIEGGANANTVVIGETIYFSIDDAMHGSELWKYTYKGSSSGINKIDKTDQLNVYPNPCSNDLNITSNTSIEKVEVYSLTGILQTSFFIKNTLDVSNLNTGVYFIKVYTEKGSAVKKFVKQ